MLPNAIVNNPRTKAIWAAQTGKDKKPQIVGYLLDGVYWQSYTFEHLARNAGAGIVNMKGMDLANYLELAPVANTWRIVEAKTQKALYIPFKSIAVLLEAKVAKQANIGWGLQIFVPLDRFTPGDKKPLDLPAIQKMML